MDVSNQAVDQAPGMSGAETSVSGSQQNMPETSSTNSSATPCNDRLGPGEQFPGSPVTVAEQSGSALGAEDTSSVSQESVPVSPSHVTKDPTGSSAVGDLSPTVQEEDPGQAQETIATVGTEDTLAGGTLDTGIVVEQETVSEETGNLSLSQAIKSEAVSSSDDEIVQASGKPVINYKLRNEREKRKGKGKRKNTYRTSQTKTLTGQIDAARLERLAKLEAKKALKSKTVARGPSNAKLPGVVPTQTFAEIAAVEQAPTLLTQSGFPTLAAAGLRTLSPVKSVPTKLGSPNQGGSTKVPVLIVPVATVETKSHPESSAGRGDEEEAMDVQTTSAPSPLASLGLSKLELNPPPTPQRLVTQSGPPRARVNTSGIQQDGNGTLPELRTVVGSGGNPGPSPPPPEKMETDENSNVVQFRKASPSSSEEEEPKESGSEVDEDDHPYWVRKAPTWYDARAPQFNPALVKMILDRGHTTYPELEETVSVKVNELPFAEFTKETYTALCAAFAQNDFRCPIKGCEPASAIAGSLRVPVATQLDGKTTPRDGGAGGYMVGIGIEFGLGGNSYSSVCVRPERLVRHWLAYHLRKGTAPLVPCPIPECRRQLAGKREQAVSYYDFLTVGRHIDEKHSNQPKGLKGVIAKWKERWESVLPCEAGLSILNSPCQSLSGQSFRAHFVSKVPDRNWDKVREDASVVRKVGMVGVYAFTNMPLREPTPVQVKQIREHDLRGTGPSPFMVKEGKVERRPLSSDKTKSLSKLAETTLGGKSQEPKGAMSQVPSKAGKARPRRKQTAQEQEYKEMGLANVKVPVQSDGMNTETWAEQVEEDEKGGNDDGFQETDSRNARKRRASARRDQSADSRHSRRDLSTDSRYSAGSGTASKPKTPRYEDSDPTYVPDSRSAQSDSGSNAGAKSSGNVRNAREDEDRRPYKGGFGPTLVVTRGSAYVRRMVELCRGRAGMTYHLIANYTAKETKALEKRHDDIKDPIWNRMSKKEQCYVHLDRTRQFDFVHLEGVMWHYDQESKEGGATSVRRGNRARPVTRSTRSATVSSAVSYADAASPKAKSKGGQRSGRPSSPSPTTSSKSLGSKKLVVVIPALSGEEILKSKKGGSPGVLEEKRKQRDKINAEGNLIPVATSLSQGAQLPLASGGIFCAKDASEAEVEASICKSVHQTLTKSGASFATWLDKMIVLGEETVTEALANDPMGGTIWAQRYAGLNVMMTLFRKEFEEHQNSLFGVFEAQQNDQLNHEAALGRADVRIAGLEADLREALNKEQVAQAEVMTAVSAQSAAEAKVKAADSRCVQVEEALCKEKADGQLVSVVLKAANTKLQGSLKAERATTARLKTQQEDGMLERTTLAKEVTELRAELARAEAKASAAENQAQTAREATTAAEAKAKKAEGLINEEKVLHLKALQEVQAQVAQAQAEAASAPSLTEVDPDVTDAQVRGHHLYEQLLDDRAERDSQIDQYREEQEGLLAKAWSTPGNTQVRAQLVPGRNRFMWLDRLTWVNDPGRKSSNVTKSRSKRFRRALRTAQTEMRMLMGQMRETAGGDHHGEGGVSPMAVDSEMREIHSLVNNLRRLQLNACEGPVTSSDGWTWTAISEMNAASNVQLAIRQSNGIERVISSSQGIVISPEGTDVDMWQAAPTASGAAPGSSIEIMQGNVMQGLAEAMRLTLAEQTTQVQQGLEQASNTISTVVREVDAARDARNRNERTPNRPTAQPAVADNLQYHLLDRAVRDVDGKIDQQSCRLKAMHDSVTELTNELRTTFGMSSPLVAQVKQEQESTGSPGVSSPAIPSPPVSPGSMLESVTRKVDNLRVQGTPGTVGRSAAGTAAAAPAPSTPRLSISPPTLRLTTPSGAVSCNVPMDVSPSVSGSEDHPAADSPRNPAASPALLSPGMGGSAALAEAERNLEECPELETQLLDQSRGSQDRGSDSDDSSEDDGSDRGSDHGSDSGESTVVFGDPDEEEKKSRE